MAAADLHELMRCWENYHRILAGEAHLRHILFREETPKIDDEKWKVFTISQYNKETNEWKFETLPYKQLVS